jgi:UDP-N-acetylglucosamine/UDP-N-acetylgalactosamine diphosphorylase
MEIDSAIQQRLTKAKQTHLLAYWSELNDEQRKILLHDISEVDFERVQHAYDTIKHELLTEINGDTKDKIPEVIDDMMEPIPDHMAGSINEASKDQLENYRQQGLKAVSEGAVCVLLLAGGQGTRLGMIIIFLRNNSYSFLFQGVDYPKGMFDVDLPSKKSLYQIQAERIRRLEQLAYEQYHTETGSIPWFVFSLKSKIYAQEKFS